MKIILNLVLKLFKLIYLNFKTKLWSLRDFILSPKNKTSSFTNPVSLVFLKKIINNN